GRGDVPVGAATAAINLTVVNPTADGYLTLYPCGQRPDTSTLNYFTGQVVPNGAITALSPTGSVCVFTLAAAHVLIDVAGYIPADDSITTFTPVRVLDTRPGEPTVDGLPATRVRVPADGVVKVPIADRLS